MIAQGISDSRLQIQAPLSSETRYWNTIESGDFLAAWHPTAGLAQGVECKVLTRDTEFPEFAKVSFDVLMLDTVKSGLIYRADVREIWIQLVDYAPVCPLMCSISDVSCG